MGIVAAAWQRGGRASLGARLFWVASLAVAAHASALRAGFVWLDHAHIEERLAIAAPAHFLDLFREPFAGTGFYRPLTALSLSIEALFGSPWLYHLANLGFHAAASVLVVVAAGALGLSRRSGTLSGALFAVHPLTSLPAAAIAFRSESMITIALLALIVAHVRQRPILAALSIFAGGLTKETALALAPLFVLALEIIPRTRSRNRRLLGGEALGLGGALALRWAYAPAWPAQFPELGASHAVGTRLLALAKSASELALPSDPLVCDAFPVTGAFAPLALLGAVVAIAVVVAAKRGGAPGLLFALALLPSLQLFPTLRWWSPHYLYIPLAFVMMLVAERVVSRGANWFAGALVVCSILAVVSWTDGRRYASDSTLWTAEVTREPACREGSFYLGEAARKRGQFQAAAERYEAALRSRPGILAYVDTSATLQNLGVVRSELGQHDLAERAFESALTLEGTELGRRKLHCDLATLALRRGNAQKALEEIEPEARRSDALPAGLAVYAKALALLGRPRQAEEALARLRERKRASGD